MHFSLFTKLMPWDHAPGVLLHREAGGHAAYLEGGAYEPGRHRSAAACCWRPIPRVGGRLHALLLGDD